MGVNGCLGNSGVPFIDVAHASVVSQKGGHQMINTHVPGVYSAYGCLKTQDQVQQMLCCW